MSSTSSTIPATGSVRERTAEWILVLTTVFWAGTFVFTKTALETCDPFLFVGIRFTLAVGICVVIWSAMFRRWDMDIARDGVLIGLCYGLGFIFQTWGLQFTTISKSAFITGMVVVFVPAVDWVIQRSRVTRVQAITVVIATIGLVLLTNPDGGDVNKGDAMTLAGSLMWAFCISYLDKSSNRYGDRPFYMPILVFVQFAVTSVLGLTAFLIGSGAAAGAGVMADMNARVTTIEPSTWSYPVMLALAYTAIFGSFASTTLQTRYQRYVSPVKAGVIFTLEPVIASFIAYFTHAERLGMQEFIGAVLMIGAVILGDVLKDKTTVNKQ
ncbi:MAG: DMT family transporter [Candidatus Kapaibacterium sp.]